MKPSLNRFFSWYERNKTLNLGVAAFLFTLQLVHLYWLTTDVVLFKLTGKSYFNPTETFESLILIVDYLEIPAIFSTSLVYINELRKKFNSKSLWFLFFINSQWLHIFWITDEFVVDKFTGIETSTALPVWLAWTAIMIDYLELPVIFDTLKQFFASLKKEGLTSALEKLKED